MSTCKRIFADVRQINNCKDILEKNSQRFSELAQVLALAGNEVRLKILYLLEEESELCPCDLSDILYMTIPAVSQHLRKLKEGNIIQFRKTGQTIYYSLKPENLKILQSFFKQINEMNNKPETA
jgi:DNA-binding transcriptional ArsR family regulator